ncbi:MAG: AbrB/MazE/SpoVT family DNA-binding domain-containing protein [Candidatus Bathyarchaeota archaeon]|nr:AbrB/MazE/SpoVT family DNA-binding domain-containing protein [Candidatus Bathyarchaeota archaeon]
MEQRKIMSLGRSSLVISLPKHWVNMNELKRGDVVSLAVQRNNSLVVVPGAEKKREPKEAVIKVDPDEKETILVRTIIACYLNGYSIIRLISKKIFSIVQQKAIRRIVGILYMRIMESNAKTMQIQTLIDESKASVVSGLRRMHLIASPMFRDALNSLKNQDAKLARAIHTLDDDVDHFSFFLLRLLRSAALDPALSNELGLEPIDCLDYQTLVHRIEHVADHATNIAKQVIMLSGRNQMVSTSLIKLIVAEGYIALDSYNKAVDAFFSKKVEISDEIIETQKRVETLDTEIASKSFATEKNALVICATCSIRDSVKRIAEYAADIAEITINQSRKAAA